MRSDDGEAHRLSGQRCNSLLPAPLPPLPCTTDFVKEHSADIRRQLPAGTPQKEVLSRVAGMWADKQRAAAQAGVAAASAAASGSSEGASSSVVDLTGL